MYLLYILYPILTVITATALIADIFWGDYTSKIKRVVGVSLTAAWLGMTLVITGLYGAIWLLVLTTPAIITMIRLPSFKIPEGENAIPILSLMVIVLFFPIYLATGSLDFNSYLVFVSVFISATLGALFAYLNDDSDIYQRQF